MFGIHEIWQWREQVGKRPELRTKYSGRRLETIEIDFSRERDEFPPPERIGDFYPPTKIFGQPCDPWCLDGTREGYVIEAPPPVLKTFRDARIIGFDAVLARGSVQISHSSRATDVKGFLDSNSYGAQGFIAEEIDARAYVHFGTRDAPQRIDARAIFFPNIEPGNYGSFLFRSLPQMLHIASMGIQADCYIVAERTAWTLEALRILGYPERPVYGAEEVTGDVFASITMCIMDDLEGFVRPETRAAIQQMAGVAGNGSLATGDRQKLYISRDLRSLTAPDYRRMTNEAKLQQLASARGFKVVRPETLSLRGQIQVFASASHIVGPSGSGMLNAMFSFQSARVVDIETMHVTVSQHAKIYSSSKHEYAFAFADTAADDERAPHLRRWAAPMGLMEQAFDWCLS